jgi:hypothetical protein
VKCKFSKEVFFYNALDEIFMNFFWIYGFLSYLCGMLFSNFKGNVYKASFEIKPAFL